MDVIKPPGLTVKETMRAIARAMEYGRSTGFLPIIHVPLRTGAINDDRVAAVFFKKYGNSFKPFKVEVSDERTDGGP